MKIRGGTQMTQEDKELLLKDLCARLPYGVVVKDRNGVHTLTPGNTEFIDLFNGKCNIAPYLFPLSSMTEEQRKELQELHFDYISDEIFNDIEFVYHYDCTHLIDWFIKNHFDYRGLIPKGLAIDATNLNIY